MKKIYLLLLFFPLGLIAQSEDTKSEPEKAQDSISNQAEKTQNDLEMIKKAAADAVTATVQKVKQTTTPVCIFGNCKDGQGTMNYRSGTYKGQWKNGLRYGQGKFTWNNGDTYNGTWFEDKRHGEGIYIWGDGSRYKGHYSHGVRSGYGIYYYTNGTIYEGTWQSNLKHGIANFYYKESVNIGGRYFNNEYVNGTGITQGTYKHKPE
ncbi:MAG: hypothetical protein L3J20_04575 [Flavobacteriaceae bacterium]|nr:hypothetical protein [Flavobacteriaceae bacterium]